MAVALGPQIHGDFESPDATALSEILARFGLRSSSSTALLPLGANDIVYTCGLIVANASANPLTIQIYDGPNNTPGAGATIAYVVVPANDSIVIDWSQSPRPGLKGTYPKVRASAAGQIYVTGQFTANRT